MHKTLEKAKHHWKAIALIAGILFLFIITLIVGWKLYNKLNDERTLKNEQKKNLANTNTNSTSGNSNTNTEAPPADTSSGIKTGTNHLKSNDKIWASKETQLYKSPSLGTDNFALVTPKGNYLGQVQSVASNGTVHVRLYTYTAPTDLGYDFYIPGIYAPFYVKP